MSRKGENIYKRKDGRWEGRYLKRIPGEKPRYGYVYAKTYRDAKIKLRQASTAWEQSQPRNDETLFGACAAQWETYIQPQVKESTFVKYHTTIQKHLLPALGDTPLRELTYERIVTLSKELLTKLSSRTVADILSLLRSILRFAQLRGAHVPCDGSQIRIRRQAPEIRILSLWEQDLLCRYLYHDLTARNAAILLSLFAGLRVGEVCALRWEDIDIPQRLLHVRRTMQRISNLSAEGSRTRVIVTPPKSSDSIRTIPLSEELVRVLLSLPVSHKGYFLTGTEDSYVEPRSMQYYFARVVARSGIDRANYHALRHTFATRCVEMGFDAKCLSELLGHSTVTMTMDRYVHPTVEHKRSQLQKLAPMVTAQLTAKRSFI